MKVLNEALDAITIVAASNSVFRWLSPTLAALYSMAFCFQCVSNSEVGVVERLGKFTGLASPGLNCILWPIDNVSTTLHLQVATDSSYYLGCYCYRDLRPFHLPRCVQILSRPPFVPSTLHIYRK